MASSTAVTHEAPVRVSVVIVNYRSYDELAACIESLRARSAPDVELVVVDHASQRPSAEALQARFACVQWILADDNPGFAAGVNRGARVSRGQYLLLLNPDCIVDQDVCGVLARWLDCHPQFGAIGSMVRDADGAIQASARRFPNLTTGFAGRTSWLTRILPNNPFSRRNLLTGAHVRTPLRVDWVSGACLMVRRQAFDAVGGMDEGFFMYWEDADLCLRLARAGWLTAYNPLVSVTHLCGRSSRSSTRAIRAFHQSAFRYFLKHGGAAARVAAPLAYLGLQARMALKLLRRTVS